MRVEVLDPTTVPDDQLRPVHAEIQRVMRPWLPFAAPTPYEAWAAYARHDGVEPQRFIVARDDTGAVVGVLNAWWYDTPDNRHRADLVVLPADNVDVAAPLLRALVPLAREIGRTTIGIESVADTPQDPLFDSWGAKLGLAELHQVVPLASLDRDQLRAQVAAAAAGAPAYEVLALDHPVPDDLLDGYAQVKMSMNDAPKGDLTLDDYVFTGPEMRRREAMFDQRQVTCWSVCARERATGQLVGVTEVLVPRVAGAVVDQWDTVVVPAHRGHGLGLWIKAVNLLRLLDERPDVLGVSTWNAAENTYMVAVNRELGFHPQHVYHEREIDLDTLTTIVGA